jgi:acetyl esterase/lipase
MPTYSVTVTSDVKYGEGLTHVDWNSSQSESMDLLLDMYMPDNEESKRPVVVFIHGGGFRGGDKLFSRASEMMHFFAERGFAGFSINYRLQSDYGTIPEDLNTMVDELPGFDQDSRDQVKAIYPATRDAKAAIRWVAANAEELGLDPEHITAIGGSAGSFISIALGATDAGDYTDEISQQIDTTLALNNLDQPATVHTVINHWGGTAAVNIVEDLDGQSRWDESDAPISIVHGTEDPTVDFEQAEILVDIYSQTGATYAFYPLEGAGHGAWGAIVDGKTLSELAYDFILQTQDLVLIE